MQTCNAVYEEQFWFNLSTMEQLTHIGHIVNEAINHRTHENQSSCNDTIKQALALLDLTILDPKNIKRLHEIKNIKILLIDDFQSNNEYGSTDEAWHKYFAFFEHLVKTGQGK